MYKPYQSCEWLEGGLAFAPDGLYVCCLVHHGDLGWPKICNFTGGPLPVGKILERRENIVRLIQSDGFKACHGCGLKKNEIWNKNNWLIEKINFSHSTKCNLRCSYCYLQRPQTSSRWWDTPAVIQKGLKPYPVGETVSSMIDGCFLSPEATIAWGGGEPLLLDEFDSVYEQLASHGVRQSVATNGTVWSDALAGGLTSDGNDIVCSVDAGSSETYIGIKKRDCFETVWKNLAAYARRGTVVAKYIFIPKNSSKREVIGFIDRAENSGVAQITWDVDAFDSETSDSLVRLVAFARAEADRRGIKNSMGGCGILGFPEKEIDKTRNGWERAFKRTKQNLRATLTSGQLLLGGYHRRIKKLKAEWRKGLPEEMDVWERWIDGQGLDWPEDYAFRMDPRSALQPHIRDEVDAPPGADVFILDAGAGPLTGVGKQWPGRNVVIFPIDVLAEEYNDFLRKTKRTPPVRTESVDMETLSSRFERNFFDFVYVCNSLHCCYDPVKALREMVRVLKPGGAIFLSHSVREGGNRNYRGMYQWDLFSRNGDLTLGNADMAFGVNHLLAAATDISVEHSDSWLVAVLRKK